MDETRLKAILQAEKAAALSEGTGTASSDLAQQRSRAMEYYLGDMTDDMPAPTGRSSAVSTDVSDTVDGLMPSLMDIFAGSDEVVRFEAVGPEDEEAAQQETDYVNHVFYNDNDGFVILHSQVKDALIQKNGIVKFWWETGEEEERETYQSLTDDAFALLVDDKTIELIEHTERQVENYAEAAAKIGGGLGPTYPETPLGERGPQSMPSRQVTGGGIPSIGGAGITPPPITLHDAVVIKRRPYGCVKVMAVPPEEFLIAKDARNIVDSRYCAHRVKRTRSQLIEQGYPRSKIDDLPSQTETPSTEQTARATVNDTDEAVADVNKAMQPIEVIEHYIRLDWDNDGIAELRKVTTAGTGYEILDNEPFDRMPFAGITPILMSHRFWGRAVADLVIDIQKIKTALLRAVLDNAYFANNQRSIISEAHTTEHTIDDLLTNRPGGIVRMKAPGGYEAMQTQPIGQHLFPVLEYMDIVREVRTGVQRNQVGPDANSLNNAYKSTVGGITVLMNAAQQRIRLVARTFAETGIKDMMLGIHALILKHGEEAREVKLRNKWVTVDPRVWKTRKDMTVMVGLGTGTRDQVAQYLMQILGVQIQLMQLQGGPAGPAVTMNHVTTTARKMIENAGFRSSDPFVAEVDPNWQPKPQPDPKMIEAEGKLKLKAAELQGDAAIEQQKMAGERERMAGEMKLEREKNVADLMLERMKAQQEMQLEIFKAQLEAETKKYIAGAQARVEMAKPEPKAG